MRRIGIYIIAGIFIILLLVFSLLYVFNIYEVTYIINPQSLRAGSESAVTISSVPVNGFGWRAPFRSAPAEFKIKEGNDLVEILSENTRKGILKLRAKNKPGKVIIYVKSKYALFPSSLEINIYPE
jgi:hypothetical protein